MARGALVAIIACIVVGCGSTPGPIPTPTSVPTASPTPTTTSAPTASNGARADESLLSFAPAMSAGFVLTYDADTTATELADPALDPNIAALATAIARPNPDLIGLGGLDDLVIVNVVRLRDASVDAEWFRGWRDSYDQAACQPAGGVSGHAEATINGHDVFIGSCAGGANTYHVRLSGGGVIVSLTSIGKGHPGERIIRAIPAG